MGLLDLIGANSQPMEEIEMPSFLLNRVRLGTIASNEDYYIANGNSIICKFCSVEMRRSETSYTCLKCGFFTVINGVNSEASFNTMKDNYTTSANSSTVLQIAGPHAARYQNNLRKNNSNYKTKQKNDTSSQMTAFINLSVTKIPPNIMREAINYFHAVQQHCITRSFNRIATMADCTYRICQKYGIVFKPKEIISIYGVEQKDLSKGSNNLDKLHSKGYLQEFSHHKNDYKIDFLNRYFKRLNLVEEHEGVKYYNFCCELIDFTQKYKLIINNIISTKCAGSIYILSLYRKEMSITKDKISSSCQISKSTFTTFSKAILGMMTTSDPLYKKCQIKIRNIFVRNGIATSFSNEKKYKVPSL